MKRHLFLILVLLPDGLGSLTSLPLDAAENPASFRWVRQAGATNDTVGWGTAFDSAGNVFVGGYFNRTNTVFGISNVVSAGDYDAFVAKYDYAGNLGWVSTGGSVGKEIAFALALGSTGLLFLCGTFNDTANFGTNSLVAAQTDELFFAALNTNGQWLWAAQPIGGTGVRETRGIAGDPSGGCVAVGLFNGDIQFDTNYFASAGNEDLFVVKFDVTGNVVWARAGGSPGTDRALAVAVDASGNAYVAGDFSQTLDLGGGATLASAGSLDALLVKYDSAGNLLWARRAGGVGGDFGRGVSIAPDGNIILSGIFSTNASFGSQSVLSMGRFDGYAARYRPDGTPLWVGAAGGTLDDRGTAAAQDASGNVYLGINAMSPSVPFAGQTFTNYGSTNENDVYVVKFDAQGSEAWALQIAGTRNDAVNQMVADPLGNVFLTGFFRSNVSFGTFTNLSSGGTDMFIAKIGASQPPLLEVTGSGTNAVIRWSLLGSDFRLESTLLLGTPTIWTNFNSTPAQTGLWNVVTNSLNTTQQFFRLNWP